MLKYLSRKLLLGLVLLLFFQWCLDISKKQHELLHKQNSIQSLVGMYLPCSAKRNPYLGRQILETLLLPTIFKDNLLISNFSKKPNRFNAGYQSRLEWEAIIKLLLAKKLGYEFFFQLILGSLKFIQIIDCFYLLSKKSYIPTYSFTPSSEFLTDSKSRLSI